MDSNQILCRFILLFGINYTWSQEVWETVFLVHYGSGVDIWDFYNQSGSFLDDANDKGLKNPKIIANMGNYKRAILNEWSSKVPNKVRLALFNDGGGLLWHLTFNATGTTKSPNSWFTVSRLLSAEEATITSNRENNLILIFNKSTISVHKRNGRSWLHTKWLGRGSNGPEIAFSGRDALDRAKLTGLSYRQNKERLLDKRFNTYTIAGEARQVCFEPPRYIYGIGVGKIKASNFVKFVSFKTSLLKTCYSNLVPYKNSDCQEAVFRPDYSTGNQHFFPVSTTKFRTLALNYSTGAYGNEIYLFYMIYEFIPVPILTIQWLFDHGDLVDEIKHHLIIDQVDTSNYKRQLSSASDNRGSAVFFGLVGLSILITLFLVVLVMDGSTFGKHFKIMKRNTRQFREFVKRKDLCVKKQFNRMVAKKTANDDIKVQISPKYKTKSHQTAVRKLINVNRAKHAMCSNDLGGNISTAIISKQKALVISVIPALISEPHTQPFFKKEPKVPKNRKCDRKITHNTVKPKVQLVKSTK